MVNVGLNPGAMLGIVLFVAGAGLYFLRSVRPELARDHDIFFMAVAVLCGGILFFQGWRLDPILTFGQFLLTGASIWFAVESIRLRGLATEKAKRNTPIVEDDRPVSRVYEYEAQYAQLDRLEPEDEPRIRGRISGTRTTRPSRGESYEDEAPRRPSRRSSPPARPSSEDRPRSRRPRPEDRPTRSNEDWDTPSYSDYGSGYGPGEENEPETRSSRPAGSSSRTRRPRPSSDEPSGRRGEKESPADYVDYSPIDPPDDAGDSSGNFDY